MLSYSLLDEISSVSSHMAVKDVPAVGLRVEEESSGVIPDYTSHPTLFID